MYLFVPCDKKSHGTEISFPIRSNRLSHPHPHISPFQLSLKADTRNPCHDLRFGSMSFSPVNCNNKKRSAVSVSAKSVYQ